MSTLRSAFLLLVLSVLYGCSSVIVAGGVGYDAGTFGVSGIETGVGGQLEVIRYPRADGLGVGLGPALELAGYQTAGDADPLAFTTLDVRYRRDLTAGANGPYWEVGSGVGVAWSAGIRGAAVPLQGNRRACARGQGACVRGRA